MIEMITSLQNNLVKETTQLKQKKYREATGRFFLEGKRAVEEALKVDWQIEALFAEERFLSLAEKHAGKFPCYEVTDKIMEKLSDTEEPQGIGAVVKIKKQAWQDFTCADGLVLVLDGVRDPGNVGTIIRTADAAGAKAVVLLEDTVDLYNPKVVRSTMGSIFHLPVFTKVAVPQLKQWCTKQDAALWATSLEGGSDLFSQTWPKLTVLVMGSEAQGVRAELLAEADEKVYIPMKGKAESLNVAVAAGICLFRGGK